jgi:hypothetical protein
MTLKPDKIEELNKELEPLTDDEIKVRLHVYGAHKRPHVLHHLERRSLRRASAVQAEQTAIARSMRNAMWVAAPAAVVTAILPSN